MDHVLDFIRKEFAWLRSHEGFATRHDLHQLEKTLMSRITDIAALEQTDLDAISAKLDAVITGISALDVLITNFQNSPGTLSAADQTALNAIQASVSALRVKATSISTDAPVASAPVITSPLAATASVGGAFSYQIGGSNSPTGYAAVGLPLSLVLNATSGLISGNVAAAGVSSVTITATNATGSGSDTLVMTAS